MQIRAYAKQLFMFLCNPMNAIFLFSPCNSVQLEHACYPCKSVIRVPLLLHLLWHIKIYWSFLQCFMVAAQCRASPWNDAHASVQCRAVQTHIVSVQCRDMRKKLCESFPCSAGSFLIIQIQLLCFTKIICNFATVALLNNWGLATDTLLNNW